MLVFIRFRKLFHYFWGAEQASQAQAAAGRAEKDEQIPGDIWTIFAKTLREGKIENHEGRDKFAAFVEKGQPKQPTERVPEKEITVDAAHKELGTAQKQWQACLAECDGLDQRIEKIKGSLIGAPRP